MSSDGLGYLKWISLRSIDTSIWLGHFLASVVVGKHASSGRYHHAIHGAILECIIRSLSPA